MIIFGSRATHVKSEQLRNAECPNCQTRGKLTASVYSKHAHVFWIPFFPMVKKGVLECQECHMGFKPKELPERARMEYKNFRGTVKTPLWKFSGLGLLALGIAYGFYSSKMTDERVNDYVQNPAMFDKYHIKTESDNYSTFKVVQVFQDSIYVNFNNYETDKISGIYKIDVEKNYSEDIFVLTNSELKAMHDKGSIRDIKRD